MHYVYVLQSSVGKSYVGKTSNLKNRFKQHRSKRVFFTKSWPDVKLVFYEAFTSKKDSSRREKYFKTSKGRSSLKQIIRNSLLK